MLSRIILQTLLLYGLLAFADSLSQLGFTPLVVKTPYLHTWITSNGESSPGKNLPQFLMSGRLLGWAGIVRVDNKTFQWMGSLSNTPNSTASNFTTTVTSEITPTRSVFRLQAGPMQFNATFFTPVEPANYVRQSMPFSYIFLDGFSTTDPQPHNIQVYTHITAEWVTSDDSQEIVWNTTETDSDTQTVYHNMTRKIPPPTANTGDFAEDSVVYFATAKRSGLTWQTAPSIDCRAEFIANGNLTNSRDSNFRVVGPNPNWPAFAFSVDLGTISPGSQPDPIVVALGLVRDPLVIYTTESFQNRSGYYWSEYSSIDQVITAFINDFPDARTRNTALDNKIMSAASAVSPEYAQLLSLVTRQIFAAMDITIPSAQPGKFNNSDVKIFMKDMGVSLRTNPVEVIYGAFPALLYFNPSLAKDILVPLLDFQSSSLYRNDFAAPDLGASYPNVLGNVIGNRTLAVENCGNMLIMVYAHAAKSGDGSLLSRYYPKLQDWANFLIDNSLHPSDFTTADGLNDLDMSNLAIKGILGIYSMAKINEAVKVSNNTYMDSATRLIAEWKQLAVTNDHIDAIYDDSNSWGLMYNLFPAIWLNMSLIENSTLTSQAGLYAQKSSDFGISLYFSQPDIATPHWALMTAATIPDSLPSVRNQLVRSVHQQAYNMTNQSPLPVRYKISTGEQLSGIGSAIQGASFGILALSLPDVDIEADPVGSPSSGGAGNASGGTNVGGIVGGIIGGLALLLIFLGGGYFLWRKRQQEQRIVGATEGEKHSNEWTSYDLEGTLQSQHPGVASAMSSKRREAFGQHADQVGMHGGDPASGLTAGPASLHQDSVSVAKKNELRTEMDRLRREVDSIRHMAEPPPGYT